MGYDRQRLECAEATGDCYLILQFMRGEISVSDLQRLRAPHFLYSLYGLGRNADITARLWSEHGAALLAQHSEPYPENLRHLLSMHGWPKGSGKCGHYANHHGAVELLAKSKRAVTVRR